MTGKARLAMTAGILFAVGSVLHGAQNDALDTLRMQYASAKQRAEAEAVRKEKDTLALYGTSIEAAMRTARSSGDLDAYMRVKQERDRFDLDQTVPKTPGGRTNDAVAALIVAHYEALARVRTDKDKQSVALLKEYVGRLDELVKSRMIRNDIEGAKRVKGEADKAKALLAEAESALPEPDTEKQGKKEHPAKPAADYPADAAEFRGHHYKVFDAPETGWIAANEACRKLGGHLVIFSTAEEKNFVVGLTGNRNAWIGCRFDRLTKRWRWVDGGPILKPLSASAIASEWSRFATVVPQPGGAEFLYLGGAGEIRSGLENGQNALMPFSSYICEWDR